MTKLAAATVELPPLADISAFSTTMSVARLALRDTAHTTATMDTSRAAVTESVMASTSLGQLCHLHRRPAVASFVIFPPLPRPTEHFNNAYCIGKGSFGTVYRADLGGGRAFAMKRLDASETRDACCGS
uniref:Protein kinase domain-containing protein n=1 Tax=Oryza glumipatula TaxID=40148 RepID=A0A0E0AUT6_9ORYZ